MYVIEVRGLPPTLNAFYSGMHWSKRKQIVDEWHTLFWAACIHAGLPRQLHYPLTLHVTQFYKRTVRDVDNAVPIAKFFADTLVKRDYLPGDGPEYVEKVILTSKKGKENKCVIQIL